MRVLLLIVVSLASFADDFRVTRRYLHLPVARKGEMQTIHLMDGSRVALYFEIALAADKKDALFWTSIDVTEWKGRALTPKRVSPGAGDISELMEQSDNVRLPADVYQEAYRPQFHFSAPVGWLNDPNGLVYGNGEYHLFYQHNPWGPESANKSWAHAASKDLLHWTDTGDVMLPDRLGAMYSGSAVIDRANTAGFGKGALIALYTAAGGHSPEKLLYTQSLSWSLNGGRTMTKYADNPVLGHVVDTNRDPKVFWHEPTAKWIMALYLTRGKFAIYGSKNLKSWEKLSEIDFPDGHECPELFPLAVDGDRKVTRWVFWEGAGRHMIGRFDGVRFTPETGVLTSEWGTNCYAGQTWNDAPDGRRLFMCWMRSPRSAEARDYAYPGMPFNQQMSFPRELALRSTPGGPRLFMQPVREVKQLYTREHRLNATALTGSADPLEKITGVLFDIEGVIDTGEAENVTLGIRGAPLEYRRSEGTLTFMGKSVRIEAADGLVDLRVLVDRTSVEIFAQQGRYVLSFCFRPDPLERALSLKANGGRATVRSLHVRELKPALPTSTRN